MKIRRLLLFAVMPMVCLAVSAQEKSCVKKEFTPKKGDFTIAFTVGYNSYASVKALPSYQTDYEVSALSTDWSDKKLMVGFETGWFFKDLWKLNLGGGLNFTNNPGYSAVPGTIDAGATSTPEDLMGEIPNYRAVADAYSFSYNVFAGVDRYFKVKNVPNMMWYTGIRAGVSYGLNEMKYDEPEAMGKSTGETWNLRGAFTMGVDYFILPAFYVGAQIDPFCYTYNMTAYKPQEGLSRLDADSHNFSLLSAPTLKMGFKFGKSNKGAKVGGGCSEECLRQLNELRELVSKPNVVYKTDTVYVKQNVAVAKSIPGLKSFVAFGNGQASVASTQEMNVLAVADYLKQYPETEVVVTGYASTGTGSRELNLRLARQRAEAVAKTLTDKYGISSDRLTVKSMQDGEQPFQTSDWNRVTIMVAE
ncbi:OmpA/MotB domain protein [Bacteroides helcogenes P 36-108]|uniref:OmpA/MotB domain protein n=2 Tax=Bacteroides helcogenes TaxID=290053 RepID=E6SN20_BACT6|nr:BT1926 family outer membrane beta-barrel protein [Bacteroides helcogenes]ADV43689.1 OmpA/MotB domain protein [Bacteroides helcogenes P 36-108]